MLGLLASLAVVLVLVEVLQPGWTQRTAPGVLAVAGLAVATLLHRHSRRLDRASAASWRGFTLIAALLAGGQALGAVLGVGVNAATAGLQDVPLLAAVPLAVVGCVRLVRDAAGRIGSRVLLDGAVAFLGLTVLLEVVVAAALHRAVGSVDDLMMLGYPLVGVVLLSVGLVTLGAVSEPRRPSAAWLLLGFAAIAVLTVSGALVVAVPGSAGRAVGFDVLTALAWLTVLAAGTLSAAADAGAAPAAPGTPAAAGGTAREQVPLLGVVVTYCLAFGAVLLLLLGRVLGRGILPVEATAGSLLLVLAFARTLLWAADGARLTRQVLRTEAWFRTLAHSAADITVVLDSEDRITWTSAAGETTASWSVRELAGRPLAEFVHPDDRAELRRALDPHGAPEESSGRAFRLRTRDGGWRAVETVRVLAAALQEDLPAGADRPAGAGRVLHLRDVDGRRSSELELERLAYTDYLTGLPNRARLMAALETARVRATAGASWSLLMLDLDGFKAVNDVAGHEAGDLLLVEVGARLRATVRDADLVGRLGGDEFAVLVAGEVDEAGALGERIIAELAGVHRSVPTEGADPDLVFDVSCSVGVTDLQPADDEPATFRQADLALRAAKAAGKDCVRRRGADAADAATLRRTLLERDLPGALAAGQLRLEYQPVVGLAERRVLGIEALVRWTHPVLGEVPPAEFVPLAEDDGLIVPLQRWVLQQATEELAGLLVGGRDLQLGVNISVRHLQAGCLVPDVTAALARSGVPAHRLMLEVTESVFIDELDRAADDLGSLHDLGCVVSLDDFGRGYSTFAYLARLPVDVLKMDREFLAGITTDGRSAELVRSIIDLGRRLGIDVVAEGVETPGELAALAELGCRFLQGWLLGRPVPADRLAAVVDGFDPAVLAGVPGADAGVRRPVSARS